jgi:hypothetical protein
MDSQSFKPDFIGTGAPKSGTSWIYECIKEHPDFSVSKKKELNRLDLENFNHDEYFQFFADCDFNKLNGEYSPEYLYSDLAAKRIKEKYPDAKLIFCLRNPINKLVSFYHYMKSREHFTLPTLRAEIEQDPRGQINKSFYYKHLQKYLELFDRDQMLILIHDDITRDPVSLMSQVYQFLGADPNFVAPSTKKKINVTLAKKAYVPGLKRILFKIRKKLKANKYGMKLVKFLKIFKINLLVKKIVYLNFRKETDSNNPVVKEELPEDLKRKLVENYRQDVDGLGKLLNRDLSFWLN